jgi:hypothetical protein
MNKNSYYEDKPKQDINFLKEIMERNQEMKSKCEIELNSLKKCMQVYKNGDGCKVFELGLKACLKTQGYLLD